MEQLKKYIPIFSDEATIRRVKVGQWIRTTTGSFQEKTMSHRCFVLTDGKGHTKLISKCDLDRFVLPCGSTINHFRDLPMNVPVAVMTNETSFPVFAYVTDKREVFNVENEGKMTQTVIADVGDVIVYSINDDGTPNMRSKTCMKSEEFFDFYEEV